MTKKTDKIEVFYKNNSIKKILLKYDYFNSTANDNLQKRLKLYAIQIGEKLYQFEYDPIDLPNKNSFSTDYWGYYNGMPNTESFSNPFRLYQDLTTIPSWAKPEIAALEGKANRSAHPIYCKAGMLEKIIYPTGGYTIFEYELNEFDNIFFPNYDNRIGVDSNNNFIQNYTQTTSRGFGLRIKSTTDFTDSNHYIKKRYIYSIGKHITPFVGYLEKNGFYQESNDFPFMNPTFPNNYNLCSYNVQTIKSYNTSYFQNNVMGNGNSIGYDSVTIEEEDIQSNKNGKIVSYFTNIPDYSPIEAFNNGYASSINYDLENFMKLGFSIRKSNLDNGLLLKKEVYDNSGQLKRTSEYQYEFKMLPNNIKFNTRLIPTTTTYKYKGVQCNYLNYDNVKYFLWQEYLLFYYPLKLPKSRLKLEKNTEFYDTGSIADITKYVYDNYDNLMFKEIRDDFGNQISAEFNMFSPSQTQFQNNILNLPKVKVLYKNGNVFSTQDYFYDDINFSKITRVETSLKNNIYNKYKTYYDFYDEKGNVIQYHNENGKFVSIIWGYNQTQPIAKIENVKYADIPPDLITQAQDASNNAITGDELNLINALHHLRIALPQAMVTTYTYKPLIGVSTITDPKGYTTTYKYDAFGRLQQVVDAEGNVLSEHEYRYRD